MRYWIVGATFGPDDQAEAFYRRGYWEMGWDDADKPASTPRRAQIRAGDRIAIKKRDGQVASTIAIKAVGIVEEVDGGQV